MDTTGIWTTKNRLGGKPCIRGHRFSMAQLLGEVADGITLREISSNFDIDYVNIKSAWIDLVNELCLLKIVSKHIMADPETMGGVNCLQGHRIPISLTLMDLLERTCEEEAEDFDLEVEEVEGMLCDLAVLLDRSWVDGSPCVTTPLIVTDRRDNMT
jgi:uncharacterized protein (DUF433 family)